jgi:hypothetical protein
MNAFTKRNAAALPTAEKIAATTPAGPRAQRRDGWLPERQVRFLDTIAAGRSVQFACALVGMSVSSVYAFRRTPAGEPFARAWNAANLLAREALHDRVMERIVDGYEETVVRGNGDRITRQRIDNRLALVMLDRLDKKVDAYTPETLASARLIAQDFDRLLGVIERGAGASAEAAARPSHAPETAAHAQAAPESETRILPPLPPLHPVAEGDGAFAEAPLDSARSRELRQLRAEAAPPVLLNRAARRAGAAKQRRKAAARPIASAGRATASQARAA